MWYILVILAVLAADQALKLWIVSNLGLYETMPLLPGLVEFKYVQNTGGGWSILSNFTWLLSLLTAVILCAAVYLLVKKIVRHPLGKAALALVIGGGLGNLIDRLRLGYVVDMFNFQFMEYPVFNIADIAVVCGMILGAVYYLFLYDRTDGKKEAQKDADSERSR